MKENLQFWIKQKIELILSGSSGVLSFVADKSELSMIPSFIAQFVFPVAAAVTSYFIIRWIKKYHAKKDAQ